MVPGRLIARVAPALPLLTALVLLGAPARASELSPRTPPTRADREQLVSVVEVDFDGDGDLDVIASDRALQLHVWVNDGTGHLTQREPLQSTAWRPVPATPAFDDRPIAD